jgi:L-amino acid N-acyltransferase YncA
MKKNHFEIRRATVEDAADVAVVYNQGIDERLATFNTGHVAAEEIGILCS